LNLIHVQAAAIWKDWIERQNLSEHLLDIYWERMQSMEEHIRQRMVAWLAIGHC
jgi:hypothetical protein